MMDLTQKIDAAGTWMFDEYPTYDEWFSVCFSKPADMAKLYGAHRRKVASMD